MTDHQLKKACAKGDRKAQQFLYDQYSGQMYSICLRYCKDGASAADALQVGFLKVLRSISKYDEKGPLGAWVRRIVINACLDQIKLDKKFFTEEIQSANEYEATVVNMDNFDDFNYKRLLSLLAKLPEGYRVIFSMNILDEMSHAEISKALNISVSTSRTQLLKARRLLQKLVNTDQHLSQLQRNN